MALRGTLTHRKTRILARELGTDPCFALGILEALWHVTAEQRPSGDIGRMSNADMAMEMFYSGDPDRLVQALINAGFLDPHPVHRLLIHDWHIHADSNTKRKVLRRGESIHTANGDVRPLINSDASSPVMTGDKSIPVPEPVPEPEPKVSDANASSPRPTTGGGKNQSPEEKIYFAYPRKEGHRDAIKAIGNAVERVRRGEGSLAAIPDKRAAQVHLYRRTQAYARSPEGSKSDRNLIPYPQKWFNAARYLDDDAAWSAPRTNGRPAPPKPKLDFFKPGEEL